MFKVNKKLWKLSLVSRGFLNRLPSSCCTKPILCQKHFCTLVCFEPLVQHRLTDWNKSHPFILYSLRKVTGQRGVGVVLSLSILHKYSIKCSWTGIFAIWHGLRKIFQSTQHSLWVALWLGPASHLTRRHVKPERLGMVEAQKPLSLSRPPALVSSEPEQVWGEQRELCQGLWFVPQPPVSHWPIIRPPVQHGKGNGESGKDFTVA